MATTNSLGHTTGSVYDQLGRVISSANAAGDVTQYLYDVAGNQLALIDANGVVTRYEYDGLNRQTAVIENWDGLTLSACQAPATAPDENVCTQYTYDAQGNRVAIVNAHHLTATFTLYDELNRPVAISDALGNTTTTAYNALGQRMVVTDANQAVTTYAYDGLNRLVAATYLADGESVTYAYDAAGQRLVMTDSLGVTTYVYDDLSRLVQVTDPFTGTVGYGYDPVGNRTRLTYPDNRVVTYTYDMDNRLVQVDDWAEGITAYEYDAAGRLITTTLPNAVVTTNQYDNANRLTQLTHHDPAAEVLLADYQYQLDGVGNRVVATETLQVPGPLQASADELLSNSELEDDQVAPAMAYNSAQDEYLVVWYDDWSKAIVGQRVKDNTPVGSPVTIASGFHPDVAYGLEDDAYLVVWDDDEDIWAAVITLSGQTGLNVATPFKVYDGNSHMQARFPDVAYSPVNETFLVAWEREPNPFVQPSDYLIQARLVPVTGSMSSVIQVAGGSERLGETAVAADSEGGYLALWHDWDDGYIHGQMLDENGDLMGTVFLIDGKEKLVETRPQVAWSANAEAYLITWQRDDDTIRAQRVNAEGTTVGQTITPDNLADKSYRPVVTAAPDNWLVAWVEHSIQGLGIYAMVAQPVGWDGSLVDDLLVASSEYAPIGQVAIAGSDSQDHHLLVWSGKPLNSPGDPFRIVSSELTKQPVLQTTTIQYGYDPLYRLTEATYSGAIAADYSYVYDSVGNMTAYTETIGSESSSVSRTFDAANRLQTATDSEQGTTSYYFDNNGNLVKILPPGVNPGEAGEQLYSFNQRNLLAEYQVGAGSSVYDIIAEYIYDGDGNRVQQIHHSGSQPVTTTYTNDNTGLSQVLVSDDGATQTANLFGLSLIHQDDGTTVRALLADGLGSVRVEMAGNAIDSATTYEPYGKLLARSGASGTVYGYTGEQHDGATGLLYLRARYYNPALRIFLSVDPWVGNSRRPMSYNKYLYVYANPANLTDPTGLDAWWCDYQNYTGVPSHGLQYAIADCRRRHFLGDPNRLPPTIGDILATGDYQGVDAVIRFFATYNGRADHRLEMLLRQTAGRDGIHVPFSIQIQFGVQIPGGPNLCPQLEDQRYYNLYNFEDPERGWGGGTSYQMSHFLTAVALAYDTTHPNRRAIGVAGARLLFGGYNHSNVEAALRLIVGHEMIGDQEGARAQYRVVSNQHVNDFISAVAYDVAGNDAERDRLLLGILGPADLADRRGNSLEDLRLSVKGWIFGHHVAQGIIRNSQDAAAWLRDNLVSRRQNRQNVR